MMQSSDLGERDDLARSRLAAAYTLKASREQAAN
jgi:hypothetical protein